MRTRTPSEIFSKIPGMTIHTLNNYAKRGLIQAESKEEGRSGVAKKYSTIEAMKAGFIWYFSKLGYSLEKCAAIAGMILCNPGEIGNSEEDNPKSRNKCLVLVGTIPICIVPVFTSADALALSENNESSINVAIDGSHICIKRKSLHGITAKHCMCFIFLRPIIEKVAQWLDVNLSSEFLLPRIGWSQDRLLLQAESVERKLEEEEMQLFRFLR